MWNTIPNGASLRRDISQRFRGTNPTLPRRQESAGGGAPARSESVPSLVRDLEWVMALQALTIT